MITNALTTEQRAVIKGLGSKVFPKGTKEDLVPQKYEGEFTIKVAYRAERSADGTSQPTKMAFSKAAFIKLAAATKMNHERLFSLLEAIFSEMQEAKEDENVDLDEQLKAKYPAIWQTIELFESEVVAKSPRVKKGSFLLKEVDVDLVDINPKIVGDETFGSAHGKPAVQAALPLDTEKSARKKSKSAARA